MWPPVPVSGTFEKMPVSVTGTGTYKNWPQVPVTGTFKNLSKVQIIDTFLKVP